MNDKRINRMRDKNTEAMEQLAAAIEAAHQAQILFSKLNWHGYAELTLAARIILERVRDLRSIEERIL